MNWQEHTRIVRQQIDALEEQGHLDGSAPAFLANVKILDGIEEMEDALRRRDVMKGKPDD